MKKIYLSLVLILVISAFLRFYNLMFDAPYFFNPDEKNMANAITRLCFSPLRSHLQGDPLQMASECSLNPHFFAYGQFPLYLAFFSDQFMQFITHLPSSIIYHPLSIIYHPLSTTFSAAILWLRFWSALTSTLTVLLVFLISRRLFENCKLSSKGGWAFGPKIENLAALLAAFTPGLIQAAHFGTTESLLTFFFLLTIYLSLKLSFDGLKSLALKRVIALAIALGLALSTKVSALVFFPIPLLAIFLSKLKLLKKFLFSFLILTSSFLIFILTSPYNVLDYKSFIGSMNYESAVATGLTKVFYTRQFENTTPILFQAHKIFPYALGWAIFLFGSMGFLLINIQLIYYSTLHLLRKYQISNIKYQKYIANIKIFNFIYVFLIFDFSFLIFFIPNAFLYAKWTRFMTPIFPLFSIFAGYFFYKFQISSTKLQTNSKLQAPSSKHNSFGHLNFRNWNLFGIWNLVIGILILVSLLPGFLFFTLYIHPDTRIQASEWIYENIPSNSYVLSETANVVDIPLPLSNNETMKQPTLPAGRWNNPVISFNFYDLDENPARFEELLTHLTKADYIFIPSRRIFVNHLRLAQKYPLTAKYYELLFSGELGFTQVAEISSYPSILISQYLNISFSDEQSEETYTVFDHPVIRIYKKTKDIYREDYQKLLTN